MLDAAASVVNDSVAWVKKKKKKEKALGRLLVAIMQQFHAAANIIGVMVALGNYYMVVCSSFMDRLRSTISSTSHIFLAESVECQGGVNAEDCNNK